MYVLEPTRSVSREIRDVVTERLSEAISILEDLEDLEDLEGANPVEPAVHDVRKRCKEVRAAARLVRSSIGNEFDRFNGTVREAATALAPIRDAHAVLATFDDLRAARDGHDDPELARVRSGQVDAADEATRTVFGGDPRIERALTLLIAARKRVKRWHVDNGFASLAVGIHDTYRGGRKALRRAHAKPTDEHLHEWRKSVKNLWYQSRLIERAAPSVLTPLVATLDDLAEALGDDHDLAVLIERLTADPDRFGGKRNVEHAVRLARVQQDDLRHRAFRLAATIYAETPTAFTKRIENYWERTVRDGPELPTGGIAELAADEHHAPSTRGEGDAATAAAEREPDLIVTDVPDPPDQGNADRHEGLAIASNWYPPAAPLTE